MKNINKSTVIIALAMLAIGLGLGWLFFSSENEGNRHVHQHTTENAINEWTCSMHPQIRQKEPGDCPICGMDLIPVGSGNEGEENSMEIKMSPTAMQLASVQTAIVSKKKPIKELRLSGKIYANESAITSQATHISGRIEKLLVNTTGEYVIKGQVIAYIYSPQLVTAQKELFVAQKIAATNPLLLAAAKEKLKNWKLTNNQIEDILKSNKPTENFPILADQNGVVLTKRVNPGDHVMQGESLYEVANLSTVWVLFDIYESDITWVKKGDRINYTIQSMPGRKFSGEVSFIDPVINPKTRVAQARVIMMNKNGELKPEMFASGTINSPVDNGQEIIIIPKSAVMWTGKKSVVYIKSKSTNGIGFMMREITTGASLGDSIIVEAGLEEGEEIAVHGTFSIDAAAQLAGKPSMMNPAADGGMVMISHNHGTNEKANSSNHSKSGNTISISNEAKHALKPIYSSYLTLKEALANDDFTTAIKSSKAFKDELSKVKMSVFKGNSHNHWMSFQYSLLESIEKLHQSQDIIGARDEFLNLSNQMIKLTKTFRQPFGEPLFVQHCPMADNNQGANWLSTEKVIKNPYFGASMLRCGEIKAELK